MIRSARRALAALAAAAFVLTGLVVLTAPSPAEAAMTNPFAVRYQLNDRGDIMLRGNSLLTCPTSAASCAAAKTYSASTLTDNNNNAYQMEFVDVDSDAATRSSSSATVAVPSGGTVAWAGLYWSGYTSTAGSRTAPPSGTAKNRILLQSPATPAYQTVNSSTTYDGTSAGLPYVSFAEVTDLVRAGGSGTYTGADIHASTGADSYAAWTLVIVVRNPSDPRRNLTVFDGFGTVQNQTGDTTVDITLSGFQTPPTGTVDARLGAVVYEGDYGLEGDHLILTPNGQAPVDQTDAVNPANNVFNSTVSDNGSMVAGRTPSGNTFGFDADVFQSTVNIGNNQSTATLTLNTGGETFFPAVATFVANIYAPELSITESGSVTDGNSDPSRTRPGDRITYTLDVENTGQGDAEGSLVNAAIPAGTTYVPGSLTLDGAALSDGTGDDLGDAGSSGVTVRFGTGATSGAGGKVAPGGTARITYTVQITDPFTAGGNVTASSTSQYRNTANSLTFSTPSNIVTTAVAQAITDVAVLQTASPTLVQRDGSLAVTWTVQAGNNGPETETGAVVTETLPAGLTGVTVPGSCTLASGSTYTCQVGTLTNGQIATLTFSGTLPANAPDPSAASASITGLGTNTRTDNDSADTQVAVNTRPDAVDDTAALPGTDPFVDVDVVANDSDPDGNPITITAASDGSHGTVTGVAGRLRYTLDDVNFVGTDTFTYQICDNRQGCDTAQVTVNVGDHRVADLELTNTVTPGVVQRAGPRTVTWTATVTNNGPQDEPSVMLTQALPAGTTGVVVTVGGGGSCSPPSGTTYVCSLGALASGASTQVTFTGTLDANAPDPAPANASVSGTITDPDAANDDDTAYVGVNRPPVLVADTATLAAAAPSVDVDVTANDDDQDGDELAATQVTGAAHGTATIVDGKVRYTLTDRSFVGTEALTVTVCDGRGGCGTSTLTLTVEDHRSVDLSVTHTAAPTLVQRTGSRTVTWTAVVTNAGPDAEPSPVLTETLPAGLTGGSIVGATCTAASGVLTCPLAALASGASTTVTFTGTLPADAPDPATATAVVAGTLRDGTPGNNSAVVSVAVNRSPVAAADTATLPRGSGSVTIPVRANDSDTDGDPLTLTAVTQPAHGTVTIVGGSAVYTLTDTAFVGTDTFTYTVCDGRQGCTTQTVSVAVANHGGAPVARPDTATVVTGTPVSVPVLANDEDAEGNPLTLSRITAGPAYGTAVVSGGRVLYTPTAGYTGTDAVTYEVCDSTGLCSTATVTFTVTDRPPVAVPDTGRLRPGASLTIDVLGNDTDPEGRTLGNVTIVRQPTIGIASVGSDGRIRYTAPAGTPSGTVVTFRYRMCDPTGACSESDVRLTVAGTPVAEGGGGSGTGSGSGSGSSSGNGNGNGSGDGDGDGDGLASTGAELGRMALLGLVLVLAGAAGVIAGRSGGGTAPGRRPGAG